MLAGEGAESEEGNGLTCGEGIHDGVQDGIDNCSGGFLSKLILGSVLALTGGGLLASGAIPMDQVEAGVSGSLVLVAGGAMLVMGCFSLAEGILSRRAAKDPSKAQPAFVFAIISLVLAAINLTWAIVGGGSPVSAIVSVAINALLVMAANTQRKEGAAEALAA